MFMNTLLLLFGLYVFDVAAAPAATKTLDKRVTSQCGQYTSESSGAYTLYTNGWGWSTATSGSQCSEIDGLSGSSLAWSTTWTWAGSSTSVRNITRAYNRHSMLIQGRSKATPMSRPESHKRL